jgi:hypothetical protein
MSAPRAGDIFQFVHVLATSVSDKTKKILSQIGSNVGEGQVDASNVEWLQHVGFASRPASPVKGSEAHALAVRIGNTEVVLGSSDIRSLGVYGSLSEGETCVYAGGADGLGQARMLLKADGGINLYTREGNAPGGGGMLIQLDASSDTIRIVNSVGNGIVIDADGVSITSGGAALTLTTAGDAKLVATGMCQMDGASVCLGSIAIPVVNSILVGPTGIVGVASGKCVASLL